MIESVDKLRARIYDSTLSNQTREDMERIADEIEAEIERDYMRLPVDVNNEPVHIGDEMEHRSRHETLDVIAVGNDIFFTVRWADDYVCCVNVSSQWHHVKPRTLEYVLEEFGAAFEEEADDIRPLVDKYAAEIRELMGGDAE